MIERRGLVIHPHELDERWLDEFAVLGLNVLGLHPVGGRESDAYVQRMLQQREKMGSLLDKARAMGLTIEYEMHALSFMMPRSLFAEHPTWFRMNREGARIADFNICAGSEEGLAWLGDRAAELALQLPAENHLYYFWLDDVASYSCHCEHCRHLSPSDQQLMIVNAMQRGIRKVDPQACVAYLAYVDTLRVPTRVKPDAGVFLEYAPFRRKLNRPIDDATCPENVSERTGLEDLLAFFGPENAKVLDYWTDNSLLSGWVYPPKPFTLHADVMRQDVAFYRSLGFHSITAFGCYLGKDYIDLHGKPDLSAYGKILQNA